MFVYDCSRVPRPFGEIASSLAAKPVDWLPGIVDDAYASGDALRTSLEIGHGLHLAKEVRVMVADVRRDEGRVVLPLRVEAVGARALFPRLDADLEVTSLDPTMTQLTLRGTYTPPLGQLGAFIDRAVLHRVAEAMIKSFVEQVSKSLITDDHGIQAAPRGVTLNLNLDKGAGDVRSRPPRGEEHDPEGR